MKASAARAEVFENEAAPEEAARDPLALCDIEAAPRIDMPDGSTATLVDGALELRDRHGVLRVRYSGDEAEISAPRDLKLSAPNGRVLVEAASDVVLSAARDVSQHAGRTVELSAAATQRVVLDPQRAHVQASRLEVDAKESRLITGAANVIAKTLHTTAETLVNKAGRYEVIAATVVEKTRDALREVSELCETRIGRARTLISGAFHLHSDRTVLVSKKETSIDGERILLG
jgi:hypothetical protein